MQSKKPRIYWVDDEVNAEMYQSSKEIFKMYFDMTFLETIDELERKLQNEPFPDVVILDIIFGTKPDEGLKYLEKVAISKATMFKELKLVVLTANSYLPHLEKILKITKEHKHRMKFYEKMISIKKLSENISDWLGSKKC
ncbi:hypothetical protein QUF90_20345 [Desulfococcaceae bacterium HSG9]|nr:hypothetical protein [Desulfococcaceae bacterium HSG9]